jgi:hypothetical protein
MLAVLALITTEAEGLRPWIITGLAPATPPHGLYLLLGQAKNPGPWAGFDDPEGWTVQDESDGAGDASREDMDTSSPPDEVPGDLHGAASGLLGSPPRPAAPFCKVVRFDGPRPGCVFKRGDLGLGYYSDSGPTVCDRVGTGNLALGYPQGLVTPVVLVLDDFVLRSPELRHSASPHSLSALPLSSARGCTYGRLVDDCGCMYGSCSTQAGGGSGFNNVQNFMCVNSSEHFVKQPQGGGISHINVHGTYVIETQPCPVDNPPDSVLQPKGLFRTQDNGSSKPGSSADHEQVEAHPDTSHGNGTHAQAIEGEHSF